VRCISRRLATLLVIPIACFVVILGSARPTDEGQSRGLASKSESVAEGSGGSPARSPVDEASRSLARAPLYTLPQASFPPLGIVTHTFKPAVELTPTPRPSPTHSVVHVEPLNRRGDLSDPEKYAASLIPAAQFTCLDKLWTRESHWESWAHNSSSSAYGIAQMLTEHSADPSTQVRDGLGYIDARYGSACNAWAHEIRYGFY
jgi:hypothetical protein